MPDIASITLAVQALNTAGSILKGLRAADASIEKAELKLKIAELAELLADARMAVLDTREEVNQLQSEISRLTAAEDVTSRIVKRENVIFVKNGSAEDGPYCPRCHAKDGVLMPLTPLSRVFREVGKFTCPDCRSHF